jgi:large subunit ribosomal protein L10
MSVSIYRKRKEKKSSLLRELSSEIPHYKGLLVVGIEGVETPSVQKARKTLKGRARIKVVKNVVARRALATAVQDESIRSSLSEALEHENALVLTNESAFNMAAELSRLARATFVKPERRTSQDIVIPAGATTLQPGPLTDSLTAFGVPFEVKKNIIYIKEESVVAKAGGVVNSRLADLLRALEIAPVNSRFVPKVAVDGGLIIPGSRLSIDFEIFALDLGRAYNQAFSLGVNAPIPAAATIPFTLGIAARQALGLSVETGLLTSESAPYLLARAHAAAAEIEAAVSRSKKT